MKGRRFIPLVVVAAGLLAYQNSFTGSYFHDDFGSILENPTIRHLWPIWLPLLPIHGSGWTVAGRPFINLSLAINYALDGYHVWGYHALNLMVHILAGLTLLGIVRRTLLLPKLRDRFGVAADELALATAVLWTVHPIQTESVTYIVQRAESIMGLFYLLTLYCLIRGAESPRAGLWFGLSVTACALGMACKEVMVSAPLVMLLYDRAFLSDSFREMWRRRWPLYVALASTWIMLAVVLGYAGNLGTASMIAQERGRAWWQYLVTQPGVILHYLKLCFWPHPLRFDSYTWTVADTWMRILPPAIVVVILLRTTVWAWRRNPAAGFLGVWFFLILSPSSSFMPLNDLIFEHRMYLPLVAVISVVVLGLYTVVGRLSMTVFVVAAVGLGCLTWRQNQLYQSDPHYTLGFALQRAGRNQEAIEEFDQALTATPNDPWLHYNLGTALYQSGRKPEAIAHYEQALRLDPDFRAAHYSLGLVLVETGHVEEAIAHWEQALRIKPDFVPAHYDLGVALERLDRVQEAVWHYEQALQMDPDFAEAHCGLGVALARLGRRTEAIRHWEQALRIKPNYAEAHYNLGVALEQAGQVPEAIRHIEQALKLKPDYAEAHYSLGVALARLGRVPEAMEHWEQAVRIKPDYAEAHYNLGVALERAGRTQEAIQHFEQTLKLKPDFAEAQNSLARLRGTQQ